MPFSIFVVTAFGLIAIQGVLVEMVKSIGIKPIRFIITQTVVYAIGYVPLALLGLRLVKNDIKKNAIIVLASTAGILLVLCANGLNFDPQSYKYPPQSLYILYGVFAVTLLWMLRPWLLGVSRLRFWTYLSKNSMWIYLWHIVPCYLLRPYMNIPNQWLLRYITVLTVALALTWGYHEIIKRLPKKIAKVLE